MELHVDREKSQNSVVFLRWCLSPQEIAKISKKSAEPYVLICAVALDEDGNKRYEESRQIFPLQSMATYLTLRSSGLHRIFAVVLPSKEDAKDSLRIRYHNYDGSVSYRDELFSDSSCHFYEETTRVNIANTSIDITVDDRSFAKKPWDYNWVNWFYECPPVDQCAFRKRRLPAYLAAVFLFPIRELFCLFCAILALFFGVRKITWRAFKPFSGYSRHSLSGDVFAWDRSIFFANKAGEPQFWRRAFFPPFVILASLAWSLLFKLPIAIAIFLGIASLLFSFFLFVVLIFLLCLLLKKMFPCDKEAKEYQRRCYEEQRRREERRLRKELQELSCKLVPDQVGLDTLPKKRRTIWLKFLDLKRKVCRPFSIG